MSENLPCAAALDRSAVMHASSRLLPQNTSGIRGVSWNKKDGKWRARIKVDGKSIYLGSFDSAEDAAATCDGARGRLTRPLMKKSALARFFEFIRQNGDGTACWIWLSGKTEGYGVFYPQIGDPQILAHRWSYETFIGAVTPGMFVLHNCPGGDNRACVNPDHLWLGTAGDNHFDAIAKGRVIHDADGRIAAGPVLDQEG